MSKKKNILISGLILVNLILILAIYIQYRFGQMDLRYAKNRRNDLIRLSSEIIRNSKIIYSEKLFTHKEYELVRTNGLVVTIADPPLGTLFRDYGCDICLDQNGYITNMRLGEP